MKTKLFLSVLFTFVFCLLSSQVPQGFNYQAIARDGTGAVLVSQLLPVRITIQTSLTGGTKIWEETHSVTTNQFGIMTLVIGDGTRTGGSVTLFSDINWAAQTLFLKTEIQYPGPGYTEMGTTQLWSVPYSLVAKNLGGPVDKLGVKGTTSDMEEALFEVKNKGGQTVFAVYNEGVRVYVDDGDAKGAKGGFAIGGFSTTKAPGQEYFVVNADSIRAYIYDDPLVKKPKGGFAIGGFDMTKGLTNDYMLISPDSARIYIDKRPSTKGAKGGFAIGGFDMSKGTFGHFLDVSTDATGIINPGQNRILWYPIKNAFLTGKVLVENKDSVGENSFTSGYESKAKGQYSQALGYQAIARGKYSTSIGYQSVANKDNSFAFGQWALAKNQECYAFGRGAIAEGFRSYAFGSAGVDQAGNPTGVAYAKGDYSFAFGQGSQALGGGSFTFGLADTAKGDFSVAIGFKNRAIGYSSFALGYITEALNVYSTSLGYATTASGYLSTAMGGQTKATGFFSTTMGSATNASGSCSTAMGVSTTASGGYSTATGGYTTASGANSFSMGYMTTASGSYSAAMGNQTTASVWCATAMGYSSTASGRYSTAMGFYSKTLADNATAMGEYTTANTKGMVAIGSYNDTTKYNETNSYTQWFDNDPVFVIGNGTGNSTRSNAVTVMKNGRVGLQTVINPTYALELPDNSTVGIGQARAYAWATYSDGRIKSQQAELSYGLNEIMKLKPSEYFHHSTLGENEGINIQNDGKHDIGLIAQEVYDIIPEAVNKPENEDKELWSISYDKLIPVLVNAIKEQQQQIESYKSQLQSLQEKVDKIETQVVKSLNE